MSGFDNDRGPGHCIGKNDRLRLERLLGEGGSGAIWLATDTTRERMVAVKFLHPGVLNNDTVRTRFIREGERFGKLRHQNLVRVYGLGWDDDDPYLVLEYVEGETLWDLLEQQTVFEPEQALVIARDIATGLSVAHQAGVVHRDLKPANVMVQREDQLVKVLDFGIAKDLHSNTAITRIGTYIGTPAYSAPEQITGDLIDHRTDIYALGVILYELLTGALTLEGRRTTELFRATMDEQNIPLGALHTQVSKPVARLIQRMTRRHANRRPESMDAVGEECDRLIGVLRKDLADNDRAEVRTVLRNLFES